VEEECWRNDLSVATGKQRLNRAHPKMDCKFRGRAGHDRVRVRGLDDLAAITGLPTLLHRLVT
jgi:hypothetical protein